MGFFKKKWRYLIPFGVFVEEGWIFVLFFYYLLLFHAILCVIIDVLVII